MTRRCSEKSPSGRFESLSRWGLVLFLVYPLLLPVGEHIGREIFSEPGDLS